MSYDEKRYTFAQLAKLLEVSVSSIWRWHLRGVKGKKLSSTLIGGRRYVLQSQLDEFCKVKPVQTSSRLRQDLAKKKLDARLGKREVESKKKKRRTSPEGDDPDDQHGQEAA